MQTLMLELAQCRSPHGERGLKCRLLEMGYSYYDVALLMESVD